MGGGDLNLKKSWHPSLLRNQERVWAEEQRALEERKKVDQLRRERDEERQIQDLHRLQEESGQSRQQNRVDWMYAAPSGAGGAGGGGGVGEEMEGYLLGKRRIDGILLKRDEESEKVKAGEVGMATGGSRPAAPSVASGRDMMAKVNADPLLEIKKREQSAWEDVVKESVRKEDRERRRKEKENGGGRREHRHRHRRERSRSRSPDRKRRDYHRSDRDRDHRRDYSRRDGYSSHRDRDRHDYRDRRSHHRRPSSSSPDYDRRDHDRRSRDYRPRDHDRYDNRGRDNYQSRPRNHARAPPVIHNPNPKPDSAADDSERLRKLAEMQSSAQDMEDTRRQRVADVNAAEEKQREEEDRQRSERGRFVGQLHQQVQGGSLDDRLRRGRGGLAKIEAD